MLAIQITTLIVLILILCLIFFLCGVAVATKEKSRPTRQTAAEPTEEEIRAAEKKEKELNNFWNYTGDPQE